MNLSQDQLDALESIGARVAGKKPAPPPAPARLVDKPTAPSKELTLAHEMSLAAMVSTNHVKVMAEAMLALIKSIERRPKESGGGFTFKVRRDPITHLITEVDVVPVK